MSVSLIPAGATLAVEVHMSTDQTGAPVFSDQMPTDRPSETITIETPPAGDSAAAQQRVEETINEQDRRAVERKDAAQTKAASEQAAKQQEGACAAARSHLESLTNQPPNRRLVIEPDGSSRRVPWEEMQAMIKAAEAQVAKDCAGVKTVPATTSTRPPTTPTRSTGTASERSKGAASERNKTP
jgi:hypothetical protein